MDKLKSNNYRQRSFSNQGMHPNYNQNSNQNSNNSRQTLQGSLQQQYNSLFQQQQQQHPYPSYDSIQQHQQQDNNRRTSINQLKISSHQTHAQDINSSISVLQNYRIDQNTQKQNTSFQINQNESFQSSIPFIQSTHQNQSQSSSNLNLQFCKNFIEFLKVDDSQKWIQVTEYFDELQQMVQMKLQHKQIYDKSQKILEFFTLNAEFIPKKFDILMSCLTQEFQNLRELYLDIQNTIRKSNEQENEEQSEELYEKWNKQIESISNQYIKIFTRHIQQYTPSNLLLSKKTLPTNNQYQKDKSDQTLNAFKQQRSSSKNSNHSFINQTFNNNNNNNNYNSNTNKENIQKQITLEDYQRFQRERILDKYSNENTLSLKIQQLEKQVKQLQGMLQAKTKEYDICRNEKNRTTQKLEELENKIHDLEKNLSYTDPNRFSSLRTGETEYLIKRHENEKNELKRIIEQKNQEIKSYRIELEGILGEIDNTSRNQTENTHRNQHS